MMTMARTFLGSAAISLIALSTPVGAADLGLRGPYSPPIRDASEIPAPIPVPMARPITEGFNYYLRVDGGWGTQGQKPGFSELGRSYGAGVGGGSVFTAVNPFGFGSGAFSALRNDQRDIGFGGFGFGAYLSPMLRGDVTVEFRSPQTSDIFGTYSYTSANGGATVNGTLHDSVQLQSTIGLVNGYIDLLPRGRFSPYVGAGVGMAYHQVNRTYAARETSGASSLVVGGTSTSNTAAFAAAGMAGVTFAFDHQWAIDINYRALFVQGANSSLTTTGLTTNQVSKATIGDSWEHQVRVGLRFNIW